MNSGLYKDIDNNFEEACNLSECDFTHEELINMLKTGNIPRKQISALKLDTVKNEEEAQILLNNLTGCDGKIREAVALKINQILKSEGNNSPLYMYADPEIYADSSVDINGNICRLVADSVLILKKNDEFKKVFLKKLLNFIEETFAELDKFIYKDKKYVINKQLFKLYWCLENLKAFTKDVPEEVLYRILSGTAEEREYTIREKTAQILILLDSKKFTPLKEKLKNDENYYVRIVFK